MKDLAQANQLQHYERLAETFASFLYAAGIALIMARVVSFDRLKSVEHLLDPIVIGIVIFSILHISIDWLAHTRFLLPKPMETSNTFITIRTIIWILCAISLLVFHAIWIERKMCVDYPVSVISEANVYCDRLPRLYQVYFGFFLITTLALNWLFVALIVGRWGASTKGFLRRLFEVFLRPLFEEFLRPLFNAQLTEMTWFKNRYPHAFKFLPDRISANRSLPWHHVGKRTLYLASLTVVNFGAMHFVIFPLFYTFAYFFPDTAASLRSGLIDLNVAYVALAIAISFFVSLARFQFGGIVLPIGLFLALFSICDIQHLIYVTIIEQMIFSLAVVLLVQPRGKAVGA